MLALQVRSCRLTCWFLEGSYRMLLPCYCRQTVLQKEGGSVPFGHPCLAWPSQRTESIKEFGLCRTSAVVLWLDFCGAVGLADAGSHDEKLYEMSHNVFGIRVTPRTQKCCSIMPWCFVQMTILIAATSCPRLSFIGEPPCLDVSMYVPFCH